MEGAKYVYCVVNCGTPRPFPLGSIGGNGLPVYAVPFRDIAAVVSDSPQTSYPLVRRHLTAYQQVIQGLMEEFTVLPVRFNTLAQSSQLIVDRFLSRHYQRLRELLHKYEDKVEMGLEVLWKEEHIYREIMGESPRIRRLKEALAHRPLEETYYQRMELTGMVQRALEAKRKEDAQVLLTLLRPMVCDLSLAKAFSNTMVVNAALLLAKGDVDAFQAVLAKLDTVYPHRFNLRYYGPVPPFHFVDLRVSWSD